MTPLSRGIISSGKLDAGGGPSEFASMAADLSANTKYFSSTYSGTLTNFSINLFIKLDALTVTQKFMSFMSTGASELSWIGAGNSGFDSTLDYGLDLNDFNQILTLDTTSFHMYTLTYDGTNARLYYDASLVSTSGTISTSLVDPIFNIGRRAWGAGEEASDGAFAMFDVWDDVLTVGEIVTLYSSGKPKCYASRSIGLSDANNIQSNQVSNWSGTVGQEIADQTGNGNTLTNNGTILFDRSGLTVQC